MSYFYIIQHSDGRYYAGSRTAKGCHPDELLKTYHTSSIEVKGLGSENFSIRKIKIFEKKEDALKYEYSFLKKVKARKNERFINKNQSFPVIPNSWKGKTEEERKSHAKSISEARKGIVFSETHIENLKKAQQKRDPSSYAKKNEDWSARTSKSLREFYEKNKRVLFVNENGKRFYSYDGDAPTGYKLKRKLEAPQVFYSSHYDNRDR